jgi:hypothetical protein
LCQIDNGKLVLTTKRLAFLGTLRTNISSLDDLIGVKDLGYGIQVHCERKQKAETYMLTSLLIVDGLVVTGAMIRLTIDLAKQLAQCALEGASPRASPVWKESPFFEDRGNPLKGGSLYEYKRIAGGALVRSSAQRGQDETERSLKNRVCEALAHLPRPDTRGKRAVPMSFIVQGLGFRPSPTSGFHLYAPRSFVGRGHRQLQPGC